MRVTIIKSKKKLRGRRAKSGDYEYMTWAEAYITTCDMQRKYGRRPKRRFRAIFRQTYKRLRKEMIDA
ncbi:hypothetical protein [Exiguobacterium sp. CinTr1]|uniref:hypothetical protein n=1 Tax=Exiguobacterium sp. CinTr1 TaxID=2995315 RepID=UPI0022E16288|nr:hypothetical protein [Exiguobacterium sp. CinTr1]